MAFINDYLTEEEMAKFEEYNVWCPKESDHAGLKLGVGYGRILCTVDRERKMYLFHNENSLERREFIRAIDYFTLVLIKNGSVSVAYFQLKCVRRYMGYHKYWKMCGKDTTLVNDFLMEEVLIHFKEALCAYGISGSVGDEGANIGFEF